MRVNEIANLEANFEKLGVDSLGKRHVLVRRSIGIPSEGRTMEYTTVRPKSDDESYYIHNQREKEQVVLHFTAGYLRGDIASLTTPDTKISVPFVIGRNGTIYNLYFSGFWAYHLGPGAIGGNRAQSASTIGVELSNIGPLRLSSGSLVTIYGDDDVYCGAEESDLFERCAYRGEECFATFTDAQYKSLVALLRYVTARFAIPRRFLPVESRYKTSGDIPNFRGIVSHVNYRSSGKWDIGPAFDWDRVIVGVTE